MPCTPQRVWRAIRSGGGQTDSAPLPTGSPDVELGSGGRLGGDREIGVGSAEPEVAADLPENNGGER